MDERVTEGAGVPAESTYRILKALGSIYFMVLDVDLDRDFFQRVYSAPWIVKYTPESGPFSDTVRHIMEILVADGSKELLEQHLNFETIRRVLKKSGNGSTDNYYVDYEEKQGEGTVWRRFAVVVTDVDGQGLPNRVLLFFQDVHEEKVKELRYQAEILRESSLARAANEAKSTFLFNISHDIRTPLNAILGYSELAKKHLAEEERLHRYLDNIQVSGERMLLLTSEVLELARIENGRTVITERASEVGPGIRSCIVIATPAAMEKNIAISLTTHIDYPYTYIDHPHMSRIALNLLNNAIKFTDPGGRIECSVTQEPGEDAAHCITVVTVADNGIGMAKEFIPRMFDMFEREQSSVVSGIAGTGLGLGIVKRLVELLHGTIEVESEVGKGSTFTVRIPQRIARAEDVRAAQIQYRIKRESVRNRHLLLAEDGDMNAEILTELLAEEGLIVDRARDGAECLERLRQAAPGYYGMVLMDIQMPGMDGLEATRRIRQSEDPRLAAIPIVAMTANAFTEDKEDSLQAGMNGYLFKPIVKNELMYVLERYLGAELIPEEA